MERLTLEDLSAATHGTLRRAEDRAVSFEGVSIDSRSVRPGEIFWALPGSRHDGRSFIASAFEGGAVASVSEPPAIDVQRPAVIVENAVEALGRFAGWYRSLLDTLVIGVTGSVGKTTTRELIHHALGGEPCCMRSRGNHNNRLGVPLTLLEAARRHRFAVVEMGADRIGDIARLARIARPEIGIITRLGIAHVETFGSEERIVRAKGELVEALPAGGFAVLPGDQPAARSLARIGKAAVVFVGYERGNSHRVSVRDAAPGRLRFAVDGTPFEVAANGRHFATGAAMAVVVSRRLGRSDAQIAASLRGFEPVTGRSRIAATRPWTLIDDTYNANPDSMRAAIEALAEWPAQGRRVFVCGDMYGLGECSDAAHYELGRYAAGKRIDLVVAIGEQARRVAQGASLEGMEARRLAVCKDRDEAATWLRRLLQPGDVAWLKASRPMALELLIAELVAHPGDPLWKAA